MKVIEKRSKSRSQTKQAKPPVDAAAALRAKIEKRTVPALREILDESLPGLTKRLVYSRIGIDLDTWGRFSINRPLNPAIEAIIDTTANEAADKIVAEVKTFEVSATDMKEIRTVFERCLREAVMSKVEQIAVERAEAVAEDLVEKAIADEDR